jgi:hypothetical protein
MYMYESCKWARPFSRANGSFDTPTCTPASNGRDWSPSESVDDGRRPESGKATLRERKGSNTWHSIKSWAKEGARFRGAWLNELFVRTRTALPIQLGTRGGFAAENNCFGQMQVTVCGLRWLLTHMGSDNSDSRPILAPTQSQ